MARVKDRQRALELRLQGRSYSQIKKELGVSKSTLSEWLRQYPLTQERIRQLQKEGNNEAKIEVNLPVNSTLYPTTNLSVTTLKTLYRGNSTILNPFGLSRPEATLDKSS